MSALPAATSSITAKGCSPPSYRTIVARAPPCFAYRGHPARENSRPTGGTPVIPAPCARAIPFSLLREAFGDRLSLAASALYRPRRHRPTRPPRRARQDVRHPAAGDQPRPLPRPRPPAAAGRADLRPPRLHDPRGRLPAVPQRPSGTSSRRQQMHRLFADYPQAITRGSEIAERCTFSLDELQVRVPRRARPAGQVAARVPAPAHRRPARRSGIPPASRTRCAS